MDKFLYVTKQDYIDMCENNSLNPNQFYLIMDEIIEEDDFASCEYCGSTYEHTKSNCPNCGAPNRRNIK